MTHITQASIRRRRLCPTAGYTLLEMVLGISVSAVLMTAMAASVAFVTRSVGNSDGPTDRVIRGADVLETINADLATALSFSERTATAVTFAVPDRDGDSQPETIRYSWTGSPNYQLTREYNGAAATVIAEDVRAFDLAFHLRTISQGQGGDGGDDGDDDDDDDDDDDGGHGHGHGHGH
jgi:hypothetical protein